MKKAIPIIVILLGITAYVYFARIRPSRQYDPTVRGTGTIEATDLVLSPKIPARIVSIEADEGTFVKTGQVLVRLLCEDLDARRLQAEAQVVQAEAAQAQAQASLSQLTAQLSPLQVQQENATREFSRASSLRVSGSASQYAVDQAETATKAVKEQIAAAKSGLAVARRAIAVASSQIELAKKTVETVAVQMKECALVSPITGTVMARNYEPGEMALPGAAILKIGRLDEVYTWIYVPNEEVGRVKLGQRARLVADTYPGRSFYGTITRINQEAEFTPKSIQTKEDRTRLVYGVKVTIPNPDGALMPGMPVEAQVVGTGPATSRSASK
jgi:HlyD family secretion protein